jgi:DNA-directed RNA polymerase subunit RPC12/RpoP
MQLSFQCPRCQAHLEFGEESNGQVVTCPHCETQIQVPRLPTPKFTGPATYDPPPGQ